MAVNWKLGTGGEFSYSERAAQQRLKNNSEHSGVFKTWHCTQELVVYTY